MMTKAFKTFSQISLMPLIKRDCVINGLTVWQAEIEGTGEYTINIRFNQNNFNEEVCKFHFKSFFYKVNEQFTGYKKQSIKINIPQNTIDLVSNVIEKYGFNKCSKNGNIFFLKTNFKYKSKQLNYVK